MSGNYQATKRAFGHKDGAEQPGRRRMTRKRPSGQGGTEEPRGRQEPRERLITRCEWLLRHANSLENDEWPQGQMSKGCAEGPARHRVPRRAPYGCSDEIVGAQIRILGVLEHPQWVNNTLGYILRSPVFKMRNFCVCAWARSVLNHKLISKWHAALELRYWISPKPTLSLQ